MKHQGTTLLVRDVSVITVALNTHLALSWGKNAQELYATFFQIRLNVVKSESLKNTYLL